MGSNTPKKDSCRNFNEDRSVPELSLGCGTEARSMSLCKNNSQVKSLRNVAKKDKSSPEG